jgi:uridine kinase
MTSPAHADGAAAARLVISAAASWQAAHPGVLVLAIDGHGAAGKSTIAEAVADATDAALVHTDDFFRPASEVTSRAERRSPGMPALACYYDWRQIKERALVPLRAGRGATFCRFDWERGTSLGEEVTVDPSLLVLLEGVFSAAPELSDLVDRSVLVNTPKPVRLRRLHTRITPEEWDDDWLTAEQAYFDATRPPSSFDLVVSGVSTDAASLLARGDDPPEPPEVLARPIT